MTVAGSRRRRSIDDPDRQETEHLAGRQTLETVGLTKTFGGVTAVDGATVTFQHGKINALIGPNGSGKTTFFNCVTGMIKPDAGRVSYRGQGHHRQGAAPDRRAPGIGRSFQLCRIFPRMTVLENMLVGVRPRRGCVHRLRAVPATPETSHALESCCAGSASTTSSGRRPATSPTASRSCSSSPAYS